MADVPATARRRIPPERFAGLIVLAAVFIVCIATSGHQFLSERNLISNVTDSQAIILLISLGVLFPLSAGVFDISVSGTMSLTVIAPATIFAHSSVPIVVVLLITVLIAVACGLLNGLLIVGLGIDPFIVTLATGTIFLGISEYLGHGQIISNNIPGGFTQLGRATVGPVPLPVIYVFVLGLIVWYVMDLTPLGRLIHATGQGREASTLSGVPVSRILYLAFVLSAVFTSLAALVFFAGIGSGLPDAGQPYLLPTYASLFLGSAMLGTGRFNVPGLFIAVFIVGFGINGLQLHGVTTWVVDTFQGLALLGAIAVPQIQGKVKPGSAASLVRFNRFRTNRPVEPTTPPPEETS